MARPSDRLKLKLGPRLSFADSEYMSTYFGVSSGEATASGGRLAAYDAGGGFRDVGLEFGAEYAWSDRITLYGDAGYRRLVGDAADSPIVKRAGSENQFTAGLGLTYRFSWKRRREVSRADSCRSRSLMTGDALVGARPPDLAHPGRRVRSPCGNPCRRQPG